FSCLLRARDSLHDCLVVWSVDVEVNLSKKIEELEALLSGVHCKIGKVEKQIQKEAPPHARRIAARFVAMHSGLCNM
ncbi:MAG: hypothetical protein GY861_28930, partial [bacterium]|nr:hypothetical protein [bacterium]